MEVHLWISELITVKFGASVDGQEGSVWGEKEVGD